MVEAPYAEAVLSGKNITATPPRTEIRALLYARVRQADGKDYRNILLDDRKLRLLSRRRGRFEDPNGIMLVAFQNLDAVARGAIRWSQAEVESTPRSRSARGFAAQRALRRGDAHARRSRHTTRHRPQCRRHQLG